MARTFKALSALLAYPGEDLAAAIADIRAAIDAEAVLPEAVRAGLGRVAGELGEGDLIDLQERWVDLFERRALSLNLFEHVHGESRDRGQAMVDLQDLYRRHGLAAGGAELPDYLPLFLEFLSTLPLAEARELLAEPAHVIAVLGERLAKRRSSYAAVFDALAELAAGEPETAALPAFEPEADPDDLEALDRSWAEEPVTFGPAASSCRDGLIARLRAAKRPAAHANS
jgi:nitrate reductase delta subunit